MVLIEGTERLVSGMITRIFMKILLSYIPFSLDGDTSSYFNLSRTQERVDVIVPNRVVERTNVWFMAQRDLWTRGSFVKVLQHTVVVEGK